MLRLGVKRRTATGELETICEGMEEVAMMKEPVGGGGGGDPARVPGAARCEEKPAGEIGYRSQRRLGWRVVFWP